MRDPINDFEIPEEWIKNCKLSRDKLEEDVSKGKIIILPDGLVLRRGYTTGTTASAAAKAAVRSLTKEAIAGKITITIKTPIGIKLEIDAVAKDGEAKVIKFAGDHEFDITDGIEIIARAKGIKNGIRIIAGKGIGKIEGKPAINEYPLKCILSSVREAMDEIGIRGAEVEIIVPKGEEIAKKTLNEEYGVFGGISILGTTGFVEPWNMHLCDMKKKIRQGIEKAVLTTGRRGFMHAKKFFPDKEVFVIGKRFELLEEIGDGCILFGLPGLILKFGNPDILSETGYKTVKELISRDKNDERIDHVLKSIKMRFPSLKIILLNYNGDILREG